MTKQFIVVQLVAAKLAALGFLPLDRDLADYGRIADKIIEMFPETVYSLDKFKPNPVALYGDK